MPRKPGKIPSYSRHKHSGQAVVRLDGQDRYLGPYGSEESYERYQRAINEWRVNRTALAVAADAKPAPQRPSGNLTVEQVLGLFWLFAQGYYVKEGTPTKELASFKYAMKPVRRLYASLPARDFGPLALKAVRQSMVDADLCRNQVNSRIGRIKRIFKWAVSEELVPPSVYEGLHTVTGLRFGRTTARETEPVKPVPDEWVEAIMPFVSPTVAAMIRVQRLSGMRPEEVVMLRLADIDAAGDVWVYEPVQHKNRWRGHQRLIFLGPKAQAILRPFLTADPQAFLFSPAQAEAERSVQRRRERKSPMTPSQAARRRKSHPRRAKRERYDVDSYRRAITYGIRKANKNLVAVPHWHPNQLRHSRATEVRKLHGVEAAQVSLGHARADVTQVYAARNLELALQVARQMG